MSRSLLFFDPLLPQLRAVQKGDRKAAEALVRNLSPKLYAVAYRILNNGADAEEIVQEALIKLWKIAPNWQSQNAKIETWLYRVTTNLCIDVLRKGRKISVEIDEDIVDESDNPEQALVGSDTASLIASALNQLPPRQKSAIILTYFEGKSGKELAEILELTPDAAESLLARGKRNLKKLLTYHDFEQKPQMACAAI